MFTGKSALRRNAQRLNDAKKFEGPPSYCPQCGIPLAGGVAHGHAPDTAAKPQVGGTVAVPATKPFSLK